MAYDIKKFRSVKHGLSDINAYCRHCNWSSHAFSSTVNQAKYHAKKNLHTVDVYRERHTEYTSFVHR